MNRTLFHRRSILALLFPGLLAPFAAAVAAGLPDTDQRAGPPKTLNTPRAFPEIKSRGEWQARAKDIREHILVSCGLWPLPEKTPLNAQVFGRIERDGYSVEKVHLQTYPGFYLAGNLYRPLGRGNGPFPGVLNPHGHWRNGRLEDQKLGSIPARCINFAKQGMVAFSYDMVGYNDTAQVNHKFASDPTNLLWNISLMGLQTWNSIRALDFLAALPDVDPKRLGCTGASGGGTQTFMLGAVDDRLAALAPCVMVSHSMQGGCLCENAPGLRVEYSNMEIAAAAAPRPQILVAATGDWTKATLTVEGPAIAGVYRLFNAEDRLRSVRFDFDHNYNQTTREAVYEWFGRWLLRHPAPSDLKEVAYTKEPDDALRVFPDRKPPADALSEGALIASLVKLAQAQLASLRPRDRASLERFKEVMFPAWQHTLQVQFAEKQVRVEAGTVTKAAGHTATQLALGRPGRGDRLPAVLLTPARDSYEYIVVLAHPQGKAAFHDGAAGPKGLAKQFLDRGYSVVLLDTFLTGELARSEIAAARKHLSGFFSTYNRTDLQERVQDLLTACAFAHRHEKGRRVLLCGVGRAGLWALLAAPAADAVVADGDALDLSSDAPLLEADLFAPGLRRIGAFAGAASLAAPHPLLAHNFGPGFGAEWLEKAYGAAGAARNLRIETARLDDAGVVNWAARLPKR
jgi:dienelactone hydrolase